MLHDIPDRELDIFDNDLAYTENGLALKSALYESVKANFFERITIHMSKSAKSRYEYSVLKMQLTGTIIKDGEVKGKIMINWMDERKQS